MLDEVDMIRDVQMLTLARRGAVGRHYKRTLCPSRELSLRQQTGMPSSAALAGRVDRVRQAELAQDKRACIQQLVFMTRAFVPRSHAPFNSHAGESTMIFFQRVHPTPTMRVQNPCDHAVNSRESARSSRTP